MEMARAACFQLLAGSQAPGELVLVARLALLEEPTLGDQVPAALLAWRAETPQELASAAQQRSLVVLALLILSAALPPLLGEPVARLAASAARYS